MTVIKCDCCPPRRSDVEGKETQYEGISLLAFQWIESNYSSYGSNVRLTNIDIV